MADLLAGDEPLPYLDAAAAEALAVTRREIGPMIRHRSCAHEGTPDGELLWTFAGGAINQTLKYGLALLRGWNAAADNFRLKLPADEVTPELLREALGTLGQPGFWDDRALQDRLLAMLPEYRLSKFQRALPRDWSLEMVKAWLVDIPGTLRFLAS